MAESKLLSVTDINLAIEKSNPSVLVINSKGEAGTPQWKNVHMDMIHLFAPPADGIYPFNLVGTPPDGIINDIVTSYDALPFSWEHFPKDLKGVKVIAATNTKTKTL